MERIRWKLISWRTLQGKIFFLCLTIALCIMAVTLAVVYRSAAQTIERNASNFMQENVNYLSQSLDSCLGDAMEVALAVAANPYLLRDSLLMDFDEPTFRWFQSKREAESLLTSLIANKSHIRMAAVVREDGMAFQSGGYLLLRSIVDSWWWESAWSASGVQVYYNTPAKGDILICRPVYANGETVALTLVELSQETLDSVMNMAPLEQAMVVAVDSAGAPVLSNRLGEERAVAFAQEDWAEGYRNVDGDRMLQVSNRSSLTGLTAVGLVPYRTLITDVLMVRRQALLIGLLAVAAASAAALIFSNLVTRNLNKLQTSMQLIERGELDVRVEIGGGDEISEMAGVFNRMMDRIGELIRRVKEEERLKHRLQQEVLATQIQPHFIYNAINSMKYAAHMKGQAEIEEIATALTGLIRSVLGNQDDFISLWEERSYIEGYVSIQRFKYRREFQLLWEVEEELWSMEIPKLLIQPLVENSLLHGIASRENGVIQVKAYREGAEAVIQVIDNGKGMTGEELDRLLHGEEERSRFRRVGVRNVLERLRLVYGEGSYSSIDSLPGAFTRVELRIPRRGDRRERDRKQEPGGNEDGGSV